MGSDAKRCGVCGDEMDCLDYGGGSVWSCTTHGVRDWMFDHTGPTLGPAPGHRGPQPAEGPPHRSSKLT